MVAPRSPKPTAGGSTPSGRARRASGPDNQFFDNRIGIVCWGQRHLVPSWGRSRHGAQLAVDQPSFRHRGFDSLPAHSHPYLGAPRLTGRAPGSYPGRDWVRGPGRAPCRRSSASGSTGLSSRRSRVRVPSTAPAPILVWGVLSTWPNGSRRRSTKPEGAGSTPAVDASSP